MKTSIKRNSIQCLVISLLVLSGNILFAQTANSLQNIPTQIKQNGESRVDTKSTTVSNNAMNKLDTASDKAFKSFTHIFKKKHKSKTPPKQDSTNMQVTAPVNQSSFNTNARFSNYIVSLDNKTVANSSAELKYLFIDVSNKNNFQKA